MTRADIVPLIFVRCSTALLEVKRQAAGANAYLCSVRLLTVWNTIE